MAQQRPEKISELPELVTVPGEAQVPVVSGGVTYRASVGAIQSGAGFDGMEPFTEAGTALTPRSSAQYSWVSVTDDGTKTQLRPHTRIPRAVVRAVSTANVVISGNTISTTFGGVLGAHALKPNDVIWIAGQTTSAENGFYRVWQVVAVTAHLVRLSRMDAFLSASGLYVRVQQGSQAGTYRLALGDGSWTASKSLPAASMTNIPWSRVPIDDYVLPGDDTTIETGNWAPVEARARECLAYSGGWIEFDAYTYRFTARINVWNKVGLCGAHAQNSTATHAPRLVFRACAGVFVPTWGETYDGVSYDLGIRPICMLRDLVFSFEAGTTNEHYGLLGHSPTYVERCSFVNPYGNGIMLDTRSQGTLVGLNPGTNGSTFVDVLVNGAGLNGWAWYGDDTNNISMHRCRSTNHAQRLMGAREFEPVTGHPSASSPALTLNDRLRGYISGVPTVSTPNVTLTGTLSFGAGACPLIRVEIDSVASGTARGQATFRVSYDWDIGTGGAGATWAYSGVTTAATYALDGIATGVVLNFPVATYATTHAWTGGIFPGDDWGLLDDAYIGAHIAMIELSSGLAGGIFSENSLSLYDKVYQELGTDSDVTGSFFQGGNPNFRSGGNSQWLPWGAMATDNVYRLPALRISNTQAAAGASDYGSRYIRSVAALTGDTTGYIMRIPTTNTQIVEGWSTNDAGWDRFRTFSNHALGTGCQGFYRGVWLGTGFRLHAIARASLPATGVPLTAGATSFIDGAYPVGSLAWETTPGLAALAYRVRTNSGSAAYNLTWSEIANPSCDMVALATGNQTRLITDGGHFVMAAGTTAGVSVITLGTTGARQGARMRFTVKIQGHNVQLVNGGAGGTGAQLTKTLTAGSEYEADYKFNGTDWIGSAWTCI